MNFQTLLFPEHARRRRRRILVCVGVIASVVAVVCFVFLGDPDRAEVTRIYETLQPRMSSIRVQQMLANEGLQLLWVEKSAFTHIQERFRLMIYFDEHDQLCKKVIVEEYNYFSRLPSLLQGILATCGVPIEGLYLEWSD